ncbi:motility associated factor glycosyltransferase family protein [bacterium]|nr:motility associated factor glycosyltransferase family protein [bacterium]
MNNIFIKNLTALALKNVELVNKLQGFIPTNVPQLVNENGNYNISYNEKLVHNSNNPLAEANEIFYKADNTPVSIHIVYGLGLGYLFQVTSLNSKGSVILYEPDLNILWFAFTLVDFSEDIKKENVFIASTYDELSEFIYQKSGIKNTPVLLSLPSKRETDEVGFNNFVKQVQDTVGAFALDLKYTKGAFLPALEMLIKNIPSFLNETPLVYYKDFFRGKTAVVVSAGPTLDRNIETLKKYRDRYVLFTVGTAVKTLYEKGLVPDFLCIIEAHNSSRQIEGLDFTNVNFITEAYSNPVFRNVKYKKVLTHVAANMPINHFYSEITGENIEEYWSKGTVSYTALNSARLLGFSKIILVGQDLAYIEGQCYSKDSVYKDLVCKYNEEKKSWEITAVDFEKFSRAICPSDDPLLRIRDANKRLDSLNSSLYYVKGINGDMIPTESVYATFVKPLSEYTQHFNDRKYINTSLVGAQIDGFENMSLEDALKDSLPVGNIELKDDFKLDKEFVLKNLKLKSNELVDTIKFIKEGSQLAKSLNNDLKRARVVDENILKKLKRLSLNYLHITSELANKLKLLDFITTASKIDLDYEMKMTQEFTVKSIENINQKLANFYATTEQNILKIEGLINESINTASKECFSDD